MLQVHSMDPSICSAHAETRRMRPTGRWGPELGPGHPHPPSQGRAWDPEHPPSRILGRAPLSTLPGHGTQATLPSPAARLTPSLLTLHRARRADRYFWVPASRHSQHWPAALASCRPRQVGTPGSQPAGVASTGPTALASCRPKRLRAWHVSWRDRRVFCSQNTALRASSHKAAAGTPWRGSRGSPSAWPWEACGPAPTGAPTGGGSQLPPRAGGKHAHSGGPDASWRGSPGALGGGWRTQPAVKPGLGLCWRGATHTASPSVPGGPARPGALTPHAGGPSSRPGARPASRENRASDASPAAKRRDGL